MSTELKLVDLPTEKSYQEFIKGSPGAIIHFWAEWCTPTCPKMDKFCLQLWNKIGAKNIQFGRLQADAEQVAQITEQNQIKAVPSFLLFHEGKVVAEVEGASPMPLAKAVEDLNKRIEQGSESTDGDGASVAAAGGDASLDLNTRIKKTIHSATNVLFMKGTPSAPRCGFSGQMVELLKRHHVQFSHFDILTDDAMRQGVKEYSDWPTYPQLYHNGEFVGGLDIVKDLEAEGELAETLELQKQQSDLNDRLSELINIAPVMVFMKGTPSAPKCGFSGRLVQLLQKKGIQFGHFDILTDESVRQGLKEFSNWQTYPQLYANGELIGGLDIVNELEDDGELDEALQA